MVLYRRSLRPGATYFFTLTLRDRSSSVLTDNIRVLGSALRTCRTRHPFSMIAIVVLPEHLHCMWALPDDDSSYSIRWALIKAVFTRITRSGGPTLRKRERALWQPRFWERTIRDEHDFERHLNYIHFNPVKHGYVSRVRDWAYSSFHRYVRQGLLPADWAGDGDDGHGEFGERGG